jgi:WD40 repeat protein
MVDRVGQQLGNYVLTRFLGKGGFAEVYLGKHVYLNTNAAIKALHVQLASSEQDSFLREARLIASLVHPNIVRVLDFGVQDGAPFLVMDYAPNGTLRQLHPRGTKLPILTVVSYIRQVAEGLQYAHNKKLIHRDIKPENLLVGANHEILLSDFGTALVVETVHNQSLIEMSGTVTYMAPEQIAGKPRPASDQYGLAVVAYEWLTGMPPFRGSFTELFTQHMFTTPASLCETMPMLSADVDQVMMTALAKDPEKRFSNVRAFANALQQACLVEQPTIAKLPPFSASLRAVPETIELPEVHPEKQEQQEVPIATLSEKAPGSDGTNESSDETRDGIDPTSGGATLTPVLPVSSPVQVVRPPQEQPSGKRSMSRRTALSGIAGIVAAGAAGGLLWGIVHSKSAPPIVKHAATPTVSPITSVASRAGTIIQIYRGHTSTVTGLAWSPDSTYLVSGSSDNSVQVWAASTASGTSTLGYTDTHGIRAVGWSPAGPDIASGGLSFVVQVRDVTSMKKLFTYSGHTHEVDALAWSPDGQKIASGGVDRTVQVWNAFNGTLIKRFLGHYSQVRSVCWSPNGQYIASGSGSSSADFALLVWSPTTGNTLFSYSGYTQPVRVVAWSRDGKYIASGSLDKTIHILDATTGQAIHKFNDLQTEVHTLAWSPDGTKLVTGGNNSPVVQVWDIASGRVIFNYKKHAGGIYTVAWSPDGTMIASGGFDSTAQVWLAP